MRRTDRVYSETSVANYDRAARLGMLFHVQGHRRGTSLSAGTILTHLVANTRGGAQAATGAWALVCLSAQNASPRGFERASDLRRPFLTPPALLPGCFPIGNFGKQHYKKTLFLLVGAAGFEPATLCSQSRCATGLRYAPTIRSRRISYGF